MATTSTPISPPVDGCIEVCVNYDELTTTPSTSVSPTPQGVSKRSSRFSDDDDFALNKSDLNKVHEELEKLNIATDVINKLELQLDEARAVFSEIQASWSQRLEHLGKKLGACIAKSRPYYEARLYARQMQDEAQKAAIRFERANTMHAVAKQQVKLTQDSLNRQNPTNVDPACLEVLNHHVHRVNEAEKERLNSIEEHRKISGLVEESTRRISYLEKEFGKHIKKSRPYFDTRVEFTKILENQKSLIQKLEVEIKQKKQDYTTSLRNLEQISEKIHEERQVNGIRREQGVGCEAPAPPASTFEVAQKRQSSISDKVTDEFAFDHSGLEDDGSSAADAVIRSEQNEHPQKQRPHSLGNGVILLAQRLGFHLPLQDRSHRSSTDSAYSFTAEHLDLQYRTVPEGVTPLTPRTGVSHVDVFRGGSGGSGSDTDVSTSTADTSSIVSSRTVDEKLDGMLKNHLDLIHEIDETAERAKRILVDESAIGLGHRRSVSGDFPERSSASGDSTCS